MFFDRPNPQIWARNRLHLTYIYICMNSSFTEQMESVFIIWAQHPRMFVCTAMFSWYCCYSMTIHQEDGVLILSQLLDVSSKSQHFYISFHSTMLFHLCVLSKYHHIHPWTFFMLLMVNLWSLSTIYSYRHSAKISFLELSPLFCSVSFFKQSLYPILLFVTATSIFHHAPVLIFSSSQVIHQFVSWSLSLIFPETLCPRFYILPHSCNSSNARDSWRQIILLLAYFFDTHIIPSSYHTFMFIILVFRMSPKSSEIQMHQSKSQLWITGYNLHISGYSGMSMIHRWVA